MSHRNAPLSAEGAGAWCSVASTSPLRTWPPRWGSRGTKVLLVEHGPGLTVRRDLQKLGHRGVESCELSFEDYRAVCHFLSEHYSYRVRLRRTVR